MLSRPTTPLSFRSSLVSTRETRVDPSSPPPASAPQKPDHIVLEMPPIHHTATRLEHPRWALVTMVLLLFVAGMCLGIGCYTKFIKVPVADRPVTVKTESCSCCPTVKAKSDDLEPETETVDPGLEKAAAAGDGSWLSTAKNLCSYVNDNKYKIGGAALALGTTAAAAYYGYNKFNPKQVPEPDTVGTCGSASGRRKGLNPSKWGPPAWDFLHSVTVDYPENPTKQEQEAAQKLVESLKTMLPCGKCRKHFKDNVDVVSPNNDYSSTKEKFGNFFADVRKAVAKSSGQKTIKGVDVNKFNFGKVKEIYGAGAGTCGGPPPAKK